MKKAHNMIRYFDTMWQQDIIPHTDETKTFAI